MKGENFFLRTMHRTTKETEVIKIAEAWVCITESY
jgi:hypothetical protein